MKVLSFPQATVKLIRTYFLKNGGNGTLVWPFLFCCLKTRPDVLIFVQINPLPIFYDFRIDTFKSTGTGVAYTAIWIIMLMLLLATHCSTKLTETNTAKLAPPPSQSILSLPSYILPGSSHFPWIFFYDIFPPHPRTTCFCLVLDGWPKRVIFGNLIHYP